MSDNNGSPKEKETSFLVKAISSEENYRLAAKLLIFPFILLSLVVLVVLQHLGVVVHRLTEPSNEISLSGGNNLVIKINNGKETLQLISVPAYQRWVPSGITLDKKTNLEIKTTGLVATGLHFPSYILNELNNSEPKLSELEKRLLKIEFNEEVYLGWRSANGGLINPQGDNQPPMECIDKASKQSKIYPDEEYGTLLAFLAKPDSNSADSVFENKLMEKFIVIGEGVKIELKNDSYHVIHSDRKTREQIVPAKDWENLELYFTINDTIVANKEELSIFTKCNKDAKDNVQFKNVQFKEKLYKEVYEKLKHPKAIWYMDNKGDFTVTIITRE